MMWKPSGVSTIWEMVPGFRAIAASAKAGQKMLLEAMPSSPPLRALPGSSEYRRASVAKRSPLIMRSRMSSRRSLTAMAAASRSGYTQIWLIWYLIGTTGRDATSTVSRNCLTS